MDPLAEEEEEGVVVAVEEVEVVWVDYLLVACQNYALLETENLEVEEVRLIVVVYKNTVRVISASDVGENNESSVTKKPNIKIL